MQLVSCHSVPPASAAPAPARAPGLLGRRRERHQKRNQWVQDKIAGSNNKHDTAVKPVSDANHRAADYPTSGQNIAGYPATSAPTQIQSQPSHI